MQLFDIQKNLGPVHLPTQMNKWDYFQGPIIEFFLFYFDIMEIPISPEKLNWNRFLPFIFIFEQCAL